MWPDLNLNLNITYVHLPFCRTLPLQLTFPLESVLLFDSSLMWSNLSGDMKLVHTSFIVFSSLQPKLWSYHILVIQVLDQVQYESVSAASFHLFYCKIQRPGVCSAFQAS